VAAINYRYVTQANDVTPPVKAPLQDAARALQFLRSKASEWNIDKARIVANGGSAGACSSLWLAFHPDMADPNSSDPIARESTRVAGAAVSGAQTTLDPAEMREWTPNSSYGAHAFGFAGIPSQKLSSFDEFFAKRDSILPWIAEYSPYALVTADDPPVFLIYNAAPALGEPQKDPTHSANFGVKLQEKLRSVGVPCDLFFPGAEGSAYDSLTAAIFAMLKVNAK
jgi:acetyl esterase/lipase